MVASCLSEYSIVSVLTSRNFTLASWSRQRSDDAVHSVPLSDIEVVLNAFISFLASPSTGSVMNTSGTAWACHNTYIHVAANTCKLHETLHVT